MIRMGLQERNLLLHPGRHGPIVVILAGDVAAMGQRDAAIEGCRKPHIVLVHDPHARITKTVQHGRGSIGRAIVDRDQLEIGECLRQNRVDCLWQIGGTIVNGRTTLTSGDVMGLPPRLGSMFRQVGHPDNLPFRAAHRHDKNCNLLFGCPTGQIRRMRR